MGDTFDDAEGDANNENFDEGDPVERNIGDDDSDPLKAARWMMLSKSKASMRMLMNVMLDEDINECELDKTGDESENHSWIDITCVNSDSDQEEEEEDVKEDKCDNRKNDLDAKAADGLKGMTTFDANYKQITVKVANL